MENSIKNAIIKNDIKYLQDNLPMLDYIDDELLILAYVIGNICAFKLLIDHGANVHIQW